MPLKYFVIIWIYIKQNMTLGGTYAQNYKKVTSKYMHSFNER